MLFGPLSYSLAPFIQSSKTLRNWVKPVAQWYANASGYRKYGFKYDDLLVQENPTVERAIERLTPREYYDRVYRLKRASQASLLHKPLEKADWTSPSEDVRYLVPHVLEVAKEEAERQQWDTVIVEKRA